MSERFKFECSNCKAFKLMDPENNIGECHRRAPTALLTHWPEKPPVDEHGCIKGFRALAWPPVEGDDACIEYMPNDDMLLAFNEAMRRSMPMPTDEDGDPIAN